MAKALPSHSASMASPRRWTAAAPPTTPRRTTSWRNSASVSHEPGPRNAECHTARSGAEEGEWGPMTTALRHRRLPLERRGSPGAALGNDGNAYATEPMTDKEWNDELSTIVASAGLPWRVSAAWVRPDHNTCGAELTNTRSGSVRPLTMSLKDFPTRGARRAEIVRQLAAATRR